MLADLEDPPAPRWRMLLIGIGAAAVVIALVGVFVMPAVHSSVIGGSREYDARLRQEDAYMKAVCTDALVIERDEALCKCALAAEFPSLDCRGPFMAWTLERQAEQCATAGGQSSDFCTCVDGRIEALAELPPEADGKQRRAIVADYATCSELPDALFLPAVETLAPEVSNGTSAD
jgi:hypothetical protein